MSKKSDDWRDTEAQRQIDLLEQIQKDQPESADPAWSAVIAGYKAALADDNAEDKSEDKSEGKSEDKS